MNSARTTRLQQSCEAGSDDQHASEMWQKRFAIREKGYFSILHCRVQKWVGGGWQCWVHTRKKEVGPKKKNFFVIEAHIEDVKQGQKVDPALVESIIRPTSLVKEKLQRTSSKMSQFRYQVTKIRFSTVWMSGNLTYPARGQHSKRAQ